MLGEFLGNSRILVTGGAGFIGSHLVDQLIKRGYSVVVLDNFFSGAIENLQKHLKNENFTLIKGDIRNLADVKKAVKNVSVVFHLAAIVNIPLSMKNPELTRKVNVDGTLNVLEASLAENVDRFVYLSTCAVYGEAQYLPIDEKHPIMPLSPYGASKFEAENLCRDYYCTHGLKTCCLRLFNVYGPGQGGGPYAGVIRSFVDNLKRGRPLVIYGDGNQTRDFIHVRDVVDACLLFLGKMLDGYETINIGTGKPTSINELANILMSISGRNIKITYKAPRKGDVRNSYADISKAQKILGFRPKIGLEDGLKGLIM